jgi:cytochrome c oxidase assembly protein subunit 15
MVANIENVSADARRKVGIWLWIGVVLVLGQIIIGGVTRLTNSGLSITEWNIIAGSIPPMNAQEWSIAFEQYKVFAAKQFTSLHADMTIEEFKFIFFWEYFHRLWARSMGFIFLFPFIYFMFKQWISKDILKRLIIVIVLAALAAIFGWIMVASGLNNDKRTWVSAYKLVIHLTLGTSLFSYLLWTAMKVSFVNQPKTENTFLFHYVWFVIGLIIVQIMFGGLMAGMRAGLVFPRLSILSDPTVFGGLLQGNLSYDSIIAYESDVKIKAIVQIFHRITAYLVGISVTYYFFRARVENILQSSSKYFLLLMILQIVLGLITITLCIGSVPVFWGAVHQTCALILLGVGLYNVFLIRKF